MASGQRRFTLRYYSILKFNHWILYTANNCSRIFRRSGSLVVLRRGNSDEGGVCFSRSRGVLGAGKADRQLQCDLGREWESDGERGEYEGLLRGTDTGSGAGSVGDGKVVACGVELVSVIWGGADLYVGGLGDVRDLSADRAGNAVRRTAVLQPADGEVLFAGSNAIFHGGSRNSRDLEYVFLCR